MSCISQYYRPWGWISKAWVNEVEMNFFEDGKSIESKNMRPRGTVREKNRQEFIRLICGFHDETLALKSVSTLVHDEFFPIFVPVSFDPFIRTDYAGQWMWSEPLVIQVERVLIKLNAEKTCWQRHKSGCKASRFYFIPRVLQSHRSIHDFSLHTCWKIWVQQNLRFFSFHEHFMLMQLTYEKVF